MQPHAPQRKRRLLRDLDGFRKLSDDYRIGTVSGGFLSICALVTAICMFIIQIQGYMRPCHRQRFIIDTRKPVGPDGRTVSAKYQAGLEVNLGITFPHVPCFMLHFDAIESTTSLPLPVEEVDIRFNRLSSTHAREIGLFDASYVYESTGKSKCGSCYDANHTTLCCNSCSDVLEAYSSVGLRFPALADVEQCTNVIPILSDMENEGCRVDAAFRAVRIKSEFHVSPGMSSTVNGTHFHDLRPFNKSMTSLNLTHTINHLYFGRDEGDEPGVLSGITTTQVSEGDWVVLYRIDVVGDDYTGERYGLTNSTVMNSGTSFQYDVSPIYAYEYEYHEPFMRLIARMVTCAGGIIFIFRMLDAGAFATDPTTLT